MKNIRLAAIALFAAACTTGPVNGTTTSANVVGKTFNFVGYYDEPEANVILQVLEEPHLDPEDDLNWATFGFAFTTTSPSYVNSDDPLYQWSVTAAPVPAGATATQKLRWPQGGIAKLRAIHIKPDNSKQLLYTFDDATWNKCLSNGFSQEHDWKTIGSDCEGVGDFTIGLVSTSPLPVPSQGFLTAKGTGSTFNTWQYYQAINAPITLTAFRNHFGFPTNEVTARYYNDGDLGLGREMHCKQFASTYGPGVACYVTNYSGVDGEAVFNVNPDTVIAQTVSGHGGFATVAMVYRPFPSSSNSVQFMVYGKDGGLQLEAPLDVAKDNVSIPQNCLSCHGIDASYSGTTVSNKAEFLPFDPYAFKFSPNAPYRLVDQQEAFRKLNQLVKLTFPPSATTELVDGMYAPQSVNDSGATAKDTYVPPAWNFDGTLDGEAYYNGIVKKYCRTCHVSSNNPALDFNAFDDFNDRIGTVRYQICSSLHRMPHAERVMKKFWESGARAYLSTGFPAATAYNDPLLKCAP